MSQSSSKGVKIARRNDAELQIVGNEFPLNALN
jgi:hypothetical protein